MALHVATREQSQPAVTAWTLWATVLGGRLNGSRAAEPLSEDVAVALVRDATDLHTGVPLGQLADAARAYRPVLKFDRDDPLRPADIDWLLGPDRRPPPLRVQLCASDVPREEQLACRQAAREPDVQRVCERGLRDPTCDDITSIQALAGPRDDFIDFAGDGDPPPTNEPDPPRMYVHVRQEGRFVFLGYWWFFRYNSSPWLKESNCLPVLSVGEITCHDHEGDWEGITVVLERRDGALHPVAGVYDAHGTAVRWGWDALERRGRRPVVYVAAGSHASYPRACPRAECDQRLRGKGLGEGGFDGLGEWPFNEDRACDRFTLGGQRGRTHGTHGPCLMALPSMHDVLLDGRATRDIDEGHRGVLWNAFWGSWGRDRCTAVGRACAQVDGPLSPSRQGRFLQPRCSRPGSPDILARYPRAKEEPGRRGAAPEKSPGALPRRLCAG